MWDLPSWMKSKTSLDVFPLWLNWRFQSKFPLSLNFKLQVAAFFLKKKMYMHSVKYFLEDFIFC